MPSQSGRHFFRIRNEESENTETVLVRGKIDDMFENSVLISYVADNHSDKPPATEKEVLYPNLSSAILCLETNEITHLFVTFCNIFRLRHPPQSGQPLNQHSYGNNKSLRRLAFLIFSIGYLKTAVSCPGSLSFFLFFIVPAKGLTQKCECCYYVQPILGAAAQTLNFNF